MSANPPESSALSSDVFRALALELTRDPAFGALRSQKRIIGSTEAAETVVADIAARLGTACEHLTKRDFAAVVLDVARMKIRLAVIDDVWVSRTAWSVPLVDS